LSSGVSYVYVAGIIGDGAAEWELEREGGGAERSEDLEALREELRRLSKQIEEAEH